MLKKKRGARRRRRRKRRRGEKEQNFCFAHSIVLEIRGGYVGWRGGGGAWFARQFVVVLGLAK